MKNIFLTLIILLISACEERGVDMPLSPQNTLFSSREEPPETLKPSIKVLPIEETYRPLDNAETKKESSKNSKKEATKQPKIAKAKKNTTHKKKVKVAKAKKSKKETTPKTKLASSKKAKKSTLDTAKVAKAKKTTVAKPNKVVLSSKSKKSYLFDSLPSFSLQNIPLINQVIPAPSKTSQKRIKKGSSKGSSKRKNGPYNNSKTYAQNIKSSNIASLERFFGGTSTTNLDMGMIRIGKSNVYTSIILDSYKWNGYNALPIENSPVSGNYLFTYEPKENRIVGIINGYNAFSALVEDQNDLFKESDMVKNIYIDRYIGKDGIKFIIELEQKAKVSVIDVQNPGRIIINLYPL